MASSKKSILARHRERQTIAVAGKAEGAFQPFGDRVSCVWIAISVRGILCPHALSDYFAGDRGWLAYGPAAVTAHQIHVDVIIVIDVGAWRQHGAEFITGGELHVMQESLLRG